MPDFSYNSPEATIEQVEIALERGDRATALRHLRSAAALESWESSYWVRVAYAGLELEQFQLAKDAAQKAIMFDPMSAAGFTALGRSLDEQGELEAAEEAFTRSIEIKPTDSRYIFLGVVQRRLGKDKDGERAYRKALDISPNNDEAAYNLAVCLRDESPDEAIQLLKQAIVIDPRYAAAYREMSFILGRKGQYDDAVNFAQTAIQYDQDDAWAWLYLAVSLAANDRDDEAERAYLQAASLDPTEPTYCYMLGNFYRDRCRYHEAVKAYRSSLELDPQDSKVIEALADAIKNVSIADKSIPPVED